jgi:Uma2 family endonuclease
MKVDRGDIFYYPDVVVACGPQIMDSHWFNNPRLVVEVLSPSTEVTDRREKALNYRRVDSIEEYVTVAQRPAQVTIYRRAREWVPEVLTDLAAIAHFRSIGLKLALAEIYAGARQ